MRNGRPGTRSLPRPRHRRLLLRLNQAQYATILNEVSRVLWEWPQSAWRPNLADNRRPTRWQLAPPKGQFQEAEKGLSSRGGRKTCLARQRRKPTERQKGTRPQVPRKHWKGSERRPTSWIMTLPLDGRTRELDLGSRGISGQRESPRPQRAMRQRGQPMLAEDPRL